MTHTSDILTNIFCGVVSIPRRIFLQALCFSLLEYCRDVNVKKNRKFNFRILVFFNAF